MKVEFELEGDAEYAFERVIESLENVSGQEKEPSEVAETVVREYVAQEYGKLVIQGEQVSIQQLLAND